MHLKSHQTAATNAAAAAKQSPGGGSDSSSNKTTPTAAVRKSPAAASSAGTAAATTTVTCKVCKKQLCSLNALVRHMKANHRYVWDESNVHVQCVVQKSKFRRLL